MTELNEAARIAEEVLTYSEPGSRMAILARAALAQGEALAAAQRVIDAGYQIDASWGLLNGTLTVGHPFAQDLRRALASLSDISGAAKEPE